MNKREKIALCFVGILLSIMVFAIAVTIIDNNKEVYIKYTFVKILKSEPGTSMYQIEIKDEAGKQSWPYMAHYIANMYPKESLAGREVVLKDITRAFIENNSSRQIDGRDSHFYIATFKQ